MLQNATEELKRLEAAFDYVRLSLFSRLHDVVREQIFISDVREKAHEALGMPGLQPPEKPSRQSSGNGSELKEEHDRGAESEAKLRGR